MTETDTEKEDTVILKGLRARLAAINEREARLPRALCRVCGGIVPKGQGSILPEPLWQGPHRVNSQIIDREREKHDLPPFHSWRRSHTACDGGPERTVRALTGLSVSPATAAAALSRMLPRRFAAFAACPDPDAAHALFRDQKTQAWNHVSQIDRAALERAVLATRDPSVPRQCSEGACAWCGVSHSLAWHASPEKWTDGSKAPLCGDCYPVWRKRGASADREDRRANAVEALSGAAWFPMTGLGIRCYVDVAGDGHSGTPGRWEYAPEPLAELREAARINNPESLPGEIRDEYREKHRRAMLESREAARVRAAEAEAHNERAEREAAAAAGWPVSA